MATLADAHIEAQARLREIIALAVGQAWSALGGYDEQNVPDFLTAAVPLVVAGQTQSVALTDAFLAQATDRAPLGIDPSDVIARTRGGVTADEVYRRPFVTVWTKLQENVDWADAVHAGQARAVSSAQMDVQLAMRESLVAGAELDDTILGYRRVPDANACSFCRLIAGQRYRSSEMMPVHNGCGCGVDVITAANRSRFAGRRDNDLAVTQTSVTRDGVTAEIREHGELGPVLVDGAHHFDHL